MNKNIFIFTVVSALALFSCSKQPETAPKEEARKPEAEEVVLTDAQYKGADIAIGSIEERSMSGILKVSGTLDALPQDLASISVPLGGFLKTISVREGIHVTKGQTLAVVENPEYIQLQQDYLQNYYQLEYLSVEYQRQKSLAAENVTAQKVFQETTSRFHATEAAVKGMRAKLQMLKIDLAALEKGTIQHTISLTSPIDGYIIDMKANAGAYISPTDILFRIVNMSNAFVSMTVFEKDITSIAVGQKVRFVSPSNTEEFSGRVSFIGKEIETDRSIRVQAGVTDKGSVSMFKGMFVTALIETGTNRQVQAVPSDAIVLSENKPHIFILDSSAQNHHKFRMMEVQVESTASGYSQISVPQAFDGNTKIVIRGASNLLAALKNTGEED